MSKVEIKDATTHYTDQGSCLSFDKDDGFWGWEKQRQWWKAREIEEINKNVY